MLQFITSHSDRYSLIQEVEMAIAGGCRWIELRMDHIAADGRKAALKSAAAEINAICKDADAFLIINGEVDLAIEVECHGAQLNRDSMSPAEARDKMGPAAVIGVTVDSADDIIALKNKDIDYVTLDTDDINAIRETVTSVRQAGVGIPIVAAGNADIASIPALKASGANGIAASRSIIDADNPEDYTRRMLSALA